MEAVFVRHTSVDVPKGTCYGQSDVDVAATFPEEAAIVKARLQAMRPFDAAYASPLQRAVKLAAFCGYEKPVLDNRLKEMSMGEWEMRRYEDITDPYIEKWYADYLHLPTPGGEGFPQLYHRVASFLDELRQREENRVVIFAHGGVLACAGIYAGLYTANQALAHQVPYGGILPLSFQ